MARGGGVRGEKRCEGREKWEMKRKKEKKHAKKITIKKIKKKWEMKNWGKTFAGRKINLGGKLVL